MQRFSPSKGATDSDGELLTSVPNGRYLLALVWFKRQSAKSGADYLRCKYEIIGGPFARKGFFANASLKVSVPAVAQRLSAWMLALEMHDEIDLDDDREIARTFKNRVFAATLQTKTENGYTNIEIGYYEPHERLTTEDMQFAERWHAEREAGAWKAEDPASPTAASGSDDGTRLSFGSDDIPF